MKIKMLLLHYCFSTLRDKSYEDDEKVCNETKLAKWK